MPNKKKPVAKDAVNPDNRKTMKLAPHTADATGEMMTTNHGVLINDDMNSLKAGERGPSLCKTSSSARR